MKRSGVFAIAVVLGLTVVGVGTPAAGAEIKFSQPLVLGSPDADTPQIGVDSAGRATLLWEELNTNGEYLLIKALRTDASGLPGPIQTLAAVPNLTQQCVCPQLAVDAVGRAIGAWQTFDGKTRRIEMAEIDASGEPQPAVLVSPPGIQAWHVKVAASAEGEAAAVWSIEEAESKVEAVRFALGDAPGESRALNRAGSRSVLPNVAAGPAGSFFATWSGEEGIDATKLNAEGGPVEVKTVSPVGEAAGVSDVVVDSKGRPTISWWNGSGAYEAKAVRLDPEGNPGTAWNLSPPGQEVFDPRLAVDGQDRVTAVWQSFGEHIYSVRLDSEGVPGPVTNLTGEDHFGGEPQVVAAPDGRVFVAWGWPPPVFIPGSCVGPEWKYEDDVIRMALIGAGGQVEGMYDASPHGDWAVTSKMALDPIGLPWVTWWTTDGTLYCPDVNTRAQASHALEVQPPIDEAPAPAPPVPAAPPAAVTLRLAKRAVARDGRVLVRAKCLGASSKQCSGALQLVIRTGSPRPKDTARRPRRIGTLPLARGRYRMQAGQTRKLSIPITKAARGVLATDQPGWLEAKARGSGLDRTTVLVRLTD